MIEGPPSLVGFDFFLFFFLLPRFRKALSTPFTFARDCFLQVGKPLRKSEQGNR